MYDYYAFSSWPTSFPGTSRRYKLQDTSGCASKREVVVDLTGPTTPGGTRYFFDSDWLAIEPSKHSPCKIRKRQHEHQNACTRSLAGAELCTGNGSRALGVPFPSGWLSLILLDGVVSLRLIFAVHVELIGTFRTDQHDPDRSNAGGCVNVSNCKCSSDRSS